MTRFDRSNPPRPHPLGQVKDGEEYTSVAAGEDLVVDVTFKNPLSLKLKLTAVRLICEYQLPATADGDGATAASAGDGAAAGLATSPSGPLGTSQEPGPEIVQVNPSSFTLHPSEVLTEKLTLRPLAPGWLRVVGVAWTVEGGADGRVTFAIKGRHRKRPKGDRWAPWSDDGWVVG